MPDTDVISEDDLQPALLIKEEGQQSMDYLYDKYSPALYGIICRITDNKHLAEECLTETFINAGNQLASVPHSGTTLFTWLIKLARESAFKVISREAETNPVEQNFVNSLDKNYSAFELVYLKGLSTLQAAEVLGITIIELTTNLRMDLRNMKAKKEKA